MIDIDVVRNLADDFYNNNYYAVYVHEQSKLMVARLSKAITEAASKGSYNFDFEFSKTKIYIGEDIILVQKYADNTETLYDVMATTRDILKSQGFVSYIDQKDDMKLFRISWQLCSSREATNKEMVILAKKYNDMKSLSDNKDIPYTINRIASNCKSHLGYAIQNKIWGTPRW